MTEPSHRAAAERPSDERWAVLFAEQDEFRLVIRCQAALEDLIDASIERLFTSQWRGRVRSFGGFGRRVTLAVAMGVVHGELEPGIRQLAQLRNRFAHGPDDRIGDEESRLILETVAVIIENPSGAEFEAYVDALSPADRVRDSIDLVRRSTETMSDQMFEFRRSGERLYFVHTAIEQRLRERREQQAE
jgi:hypothetical protein